MLTILLQAQIRRATIRRVIGLLSSFKTTEPDTSVSTFCHIQNF